MSSEKNYLNDSYKSFFEDSLSVKDPDLYKALDLSQTNYPQKNFYSYRLNNFFRST